MINTVGFRDRITKSTADYAIQEAGKVRFAAVEEAKDYLLDKIGTVPEVAIIMGSGLSAVDEILLRRTRISYATIPHFPVPSAIGHRGQVVIGKAKDMAVVVFEGRIHYYEGNTTDQVTFSTRVIGRLGTRILLLTNASGAINPTFSRGQIMIITDHINLIGINPLSGPNEDRWGPRFVEQTQVYDPELRRRLKEAGEYCGIRLCEGVYAAVSGPTYETPAEVRFLRAIGADAVGMSTIPEAIVARHMGLRVAGISMLANVASGLSDRPIQHEEVLETAAQLNTDVSLLLQRFFETYGA